MIKTSDNLPDHNNNFVFAHAELHTYKIKVIDSSSRSANILDQIEVIWPCYDQNNDLRWPPWPQKNCSLSWGTNQMKGNDYSSWPITEDVTLDDLNDHNKNFLLAQVKRHIKWKVITTVVDL